MKGSVTISRRSDNRVYINVTCRESHIEFAEVSYSMEDYAMMITGLHGVEGELTVRGLEKVGLEHQHKSEHVFIPEWAERISGEDLTQEQADTLFGKYEVDGWIAHHIGDWGNGYKRDRKTNTYKITFRRWV